MKPTPRKLAGWEQTIGRVQKGMTKADAEKIVGLPSRTVATGAMEIISYQDEQIGGAIYSIRVAYAENQVSQCYLGYELCEGDRRGRRQKRSERVQLFLVVLIGAVVVLVYAWWKSR